MRPGWIAIALLAASIVPVAAAQSSQTLERTYVATGPGAHGETTAGPVQLTEGTLRFNVTGAAGNAGHYTTAHVVVDDALSSNVQVIYSFHGERSDDAPVFGGATQALEVGVFCDETTLTVPDAAVELRLQLNAPVAFTNPLRCPANAASVGTATVTLSH